MSSVVVSYSTCVSKPLCPLLSFLTVPVSLNFSARALMVLRCDIFLPGNSRQKCLWTRTGDFVVGFDGFDSLLG